MRSPSKENPLGFVEQIKMELIDRSQSTQMRAEIHDETVGEYRDAICNGGDLPEISLFYDEQAGTYFIGDGHHRFFAYDREGRETIPALVEAGGERAAWQHALGSNHTHGRRRTPADKRYAVEQALSDAEIQKWSDRKIAETCCVSNTFVGKVRSELSPIDELSTVDSSSERKGKDGKTRKLPKPKSGPSKPKAAKQDPDDPTSFDPKNLPKKARNGAEKITPAQRKDAKSGWGKVVRFIDDCDLRGELGEHVEAISVAMKEHWAGGLK